MGRAPGTHDVTTPETLNPFFFSRLGESGADDPLVERLLALRASGLGSERRRVERVQKVRVLGSRA